MDTGSNEVIYMNKLLQAELWEIQVLLMWILDVLLFETGHSTLGTMLFVYSMFCVVGTITKAAKARMDVLALTNNKDAV